jgi:hypothetical protein
LHRQTGRACKYDCEGMAVRSMMGAGKETPIHERTLSCPFTHFISTLRIWQCERQRLHPPPAARGNHVPGPRLMVSQPLPINIFGALLDQLPSPPQRFVKPQVFYHHFAYLEGARPGGRLRDDCLSQMTAQFLLECSCPATRRPKGRCSIYSIRP